LDIIVLDSPRGDLLIFSSKASSHRDKGMTVMPRRSSSASIGELWRDIDKLDGAAQEGAFASSYRGSSPPGPSSIQSNKGTEDDAMHAIGRASLDDAPGPSSALPRGYGRGSTRSKAQGSFASHAEDIRG
jgi:hypothetical protein